MIHRYFPSALLLILGASASVLTGCKKEEVRSYVAPKQASPPVATAEENPATKTEPPPSRPKPAIKYTLPTGWEEAEPGQISTAAFSIAGPDATQANANITVLGDLRGREAQVFNMYRAQTKQPEIPDDKVLESMQSVEVAGGEGKMLDMVGMNLEDKPTRIVAVIAHRNGRSWFYRISGDDALVLAQKPTFLEFLKTVHISDGTEPAAGAATEPTPKPEP